MPITKTFHHQPFSLTNYICEKKIQKRVITHRVASMQLLINPTPNVTQPLCHAVIGQKNCHIISNQLS